MCRSGVRTYTALTVMRLAEQGEIDLDASIRDWIGDGLPLIDGRVTNRQLLARRSGVGDYLEEAEAWTPDHFTIGVPVHTLTSAEAFLLAMS